MLLPPHNKVVLKYCMALVPGSGQAPDVQQIHRHIAAEKLIKIFLGSCKQGIDSGRAERAQGGKRAQASFVLGLT